MDNRELLHKLHEEQNLTPEQWRQLLGSWTEEDRQLAAELARAVAQARFGRGRVRYRVSHRRYGGLETILHSRPLERRGRTPRRRGEKLPLSLCDT